GPLLIGSMVLAAAVHTWCLTGLAWDGAHYFVASIDSQVPHSAHGRISEALFSAPAVAASFFTDDTRLLAGIYTAAYAMVPVLCVWATWAVLRGRYPEAFV